MLFFKKQKKNKNIFFIEKIKNECEKINININSFIKEDINPLHLERIKYAIIDELGESQINEIANHYFKDEIELIKLHENFIMNPRLEDMIKKFKPDKISYSTNNKSAFLALKGVVAGDVIGEPYEFVQHEKITQLIRKRNKFTDDTVMSIAVANAILENTIEPNYIKWYHKLYNKFPMAGYGAGFSRWCIEKSTTGYGSFGNGSAMRVAFIGGFYKTIEDVIMQAYNSAIVSHNHIDGVKGAIVTAVIVWMCKNNYSKKDIWNYALKHYGYNKEYLKQKNTGYSHFNLLDINNNFNKNGIVSCNFAVPYAIYCFINTNSFDECMFKVLENFCDADTVCAIAGSFAYMYYNENKYDYIIETLPTELNKCFLEVI